LILPDIDSVLAPQQFYPTPLHGSGLLARKVHSEGDARVDMTAMVDLVFMMNIFFLVTTLVTAMAEVNLPAAKHVVAADMQSAVVITVVADGDERVRVYLGDGTKGAPLAEEDRDERIRAAVQEGVGAGKTNVVVKAERDVELRHIAGLAAAATADEGIRLYAAVLEKD
jgi:biopolymer transport protein ExbD